MVPILPAPECPNLCWSLEGDWSLAGLEHAMQYNSSRVVQPAGHCAATPATCILFPGLPLTLEEAFVSVVGAD